MGDETQGHTRLVVGIAWGLASCSLTEQVKESFTVHFMKQDGCAGER